MNVKMHLLTAILLLSAGFACAQPGPGPRHRATPEQMADRLTARMTEELGLSDDQQAQVKALHLAFAQKMKNREERPSQEEMKALHEAQKAAIAKVLTPEQLTKWEAQKTENRERRAENIEKRAALHDELRAYHEQNIQPVMTEQRLKLDAKITPEDQKTIASLRSQIATARENRQKEAEEKGFGKDKGNKARPGKKEGFEGRMPFPGGPRHGFGPARLDEKSRDQAKKLVETYSADIDVLFAEIADQREQWEKDIKAIHEKYKPENPDFDGPGPEGRGFLGKKGEETAENGQNERTDRRDFHKKLTFLLMPATGDEPVTAAPFERKINVFPNPAGAVQNIEFEVLKAGKVLVEIVDRQGNVVQTAFTGEMPAGMNKLEINTSDLKGQMYFYRITDASGVSSKPFNVR